MSTYEIVVTDNGNFAVVYANNKLSTRAIISQHNTKPLAEDAIRRYEAGDKRRGTVKRSGSDVINDLTIMMKV